MLLGTLLCCLLLSPVASALAAVKHRVHNGASFEVRLAFNEHRFTILSKSEKLLRDKRQLFAGSISGGDVIGESTRVWA